MTPAKKAARLQAAEEQVRMALGIETLDTRNHDRLDFHDVSVASIREVVGLSFEVGFAAGIEAAEKEDAS